jgi:Ser/Thr protein kinase RdoA (MazF antagonist)
MEPLDVARQFATRHTPSAARAIADGHINDTFVVDTDGPERYVLQRINRRVFVDPLSVVRNTARVVAHVERRAPGLVPRLVASRDHSPAVEADGDVWRMLAFIAHGEVRQAPLDLDSARAAGAAFGRFQAALVDYDATEHAPPIQGFLELPPYLRKLDAVLESGDARRRDRARDVIAAVFAQREHATALMARGPLGLIHADGKVNNLLFARDAARVLAVLDLDTVMIGRRAWDFGDLVRSAAARGDEDASGLEIDLAPFAALAHGFREGLADVFDAELRAACVTAPRYLTFTLAVRFLVDFLDGDRYFKVADAEHNLRRARSQLSLADSEARLEHEMTRILREV